MGPAPSRAPHLPVALVGLGLELEDPVASTDFGTVGYREDDGAAKQEARGPTGHRGAQHCLGPFCKGAGDRREAVRGGPKSFAGARMGAGRPPQPRPSGVTEGRTPPLGPQESAVMERQRNGIDLQTASRVWLSHADILTGKYLFMFSKVLHSWNVCDRCC